MFIPIALLRPMDSTKNLQDALGETETKMAEFLVAELGDTFFV